MRRAVGYLVLSVCMGCPAPAPASNPPGKASASTAPKAAKVVPNFNQLDVAAEDFMAPPLPQARVIVTDAKGRQHPVEVEVAANPVSRTRGLMWREALAEGRGMLFIFPRQQLLSFWMRNTLIPLDMVFIDETKTIVGIVHRAAPRTMDARSVDQPSLYVLEVPGGWCEKIGLKAGSTVELQGLSTVAVQP